MNTDEIKISKPEDLTEVLDNDIRDNKTTGKKYVITQQLDCSKISKFKPLGNGSNFSFEGELDGGNHAITNLTINFSSLYDLALFSKIGGDGVVTNLQLININITQNLNKLELDPGQVTTRAGAIAAVCYGKICCCSASGAISLQTTTDICQVGGLCGSLPFKELEISKSWANVRISFQGNHNEKRGSVNDKNYAAGGVVGSVNGNISACHSRSEIFPPGEGITSYAAGGICGVAESGSNITACYNIGYLHGRMKQSDTLGGIVGIAQEKSIFSSCFYLKRCLLSNNSVKNTKIANDKGDAKTWEELVKADFASSLGANYTSTPAADTYTYTPSLVVFQSPQGKVSSTDYLKGLCTPVAISFTQAVFPNKVNPVKIDCNLSNCALKSVTVTAKKQDTTSETKSATIDKNSFCCDLGNNIYVSYGFMLTLKDRYDQTITVSNADMEVTDNLSVILPHVETTIVNTGVIDLTANAREYVLGSTTGPKITAEYNYDYYKHHWVGDEEPTPTPPTPPTYYARFKAMVAGANHMTVKISDVETVAQLDITFTERSEQTPEQQVKREGQPYTTLTFVVRNAIGIEASLDWKKTNQVPALTNPEMAQIGNKWEYPLNRLVWRLTTRCNLRCRHCSSRDTHKSIVDLNIWEIRGVVESIIQLGVPVVCLSGGEILLSPHWYETAETLSRAGVETRLITNGTLIDSDTAVKIKNAGVSRVAVSIDDYQEQKGIVRDESSYQKAAQGIKWLKAVGIPVSIITTVNAFNINRLDEMRHAFTELGADMWGLKPILPLGEAARNQELWLDERDINKVTDFCYCAMSTTGLPVVPHLSFEMHSKKGAAILRHLYGEDIHTDVHGSGAGIFTAQLHPDGNLVSACSCAIDYSAGNVKDRSLADIWQDQDSFKALRSFDPARLEGYCGRCERRNTCKGGDLNVRLAFGGIYGENRYCAYRNFKLYGITI